MYRRGAGTKEGQHHVDDTIELRSNASDAGQGNDFAGTPIAADLSSAPAARTIDATGKLVLLGVVDSRVHPVYDDDIAFSDLQPVP